MVEAVAKPGAEQILEPTSDQVIKARQNLQSVLRAKTASKPSIYEHIVQVIDRIVASCPDQAIERFEEISYLIKNADSLKLEDFVKCSVLRDYARHNDEGSDSTKEALDSIRKMFASTSPAAEVDPEAEGGGGPVIGLVQDLTSLNKHVFNQAGLELGEYGSLLLQKSLK